VSFIRTGFREIGLKIRRQRTRMALRHEKRLLQKSEINLGREGTAQAANFPELRNEIVALKKLEQEQKEVALRIARIEEGIKKIEEERQQNAREQAGAIAKLEAEKKPLLQKRNQTKSDVDVCERELSAVERRARLPEERAELVRARLGSAEAARLATEKLNAAEAELSTVEKNVARTRSEFEARDRKLNDNIRAQQEAARNARAQHQTVEERKNPAYLNIGRHLAAQGVAPPNAPNLLTEAHRRREAVDRHLAHKAELASLSSQIDKQELRKFYFSIFSVLVLLAIILLVVFQSPRGREWLPQETDTILSINADQFERADLARRWGKDQSKLWPALIGAAASTPGLNLSRDAARITRAITTNETGETREFVLVEARRAAPKVIRAIAGDKAFQKRAINGLPVWERPPDFAVARVGPATLAVGVPTAVDELVLVRLGMKPDLKITGQLFDRFQALDRESAVRLISRAPPDLSRVFNPIFTPELLDAAQLLGLAINLQNPVKARVLIKVNSSKNAAEIARNLHDNPQQWLRLPDSELLLYARPPEILRPSSSNLELRFEVPENSARLLLERLAKTDAAQVVTAH
jgi:hypothetical protein